MDYGPWTLRLIYVLYSVYVRYGRWGKGLWEGAVGRYRTYFIPLLSTTFSFDSGNIVR